MPTPEIRTVKEQIAWSYANLARADAALKGGVTEYRRVHHIVRSKLYQGLISGKMSIRSLYHDERLKMTLPQACYYCGSKQNLAVDHLMPRIKDGPDEADNLIWACRRCNSSKQGRDMLAWMHSKAVSPPILLLRRYLKIVARYCEQHEYMDAELAQIADVDLPFDLFLLPGKFPPLGELKRWIYPEGSESISHKLEEIKNTQEN